MNKNTVLIIGGLAVVGVAGYFLWKHYQKTQQTPVQQQTAGNQVSGNTGIVGQIGDTADALTNLGEAIGIF